MKDPFAFRRAGKRNYFEGWYFKNVAPDGQAYSFIPGVSYDCDGAGHAFVQVIRGADGQTAYSRFALSEFAASPTSFHARVGANSFGRDGLIVDLPDAFGGIRGSLRYGANRGIERSFLRPGIMGWYRYVPFMECYHEVGSVAHDVYGSLDIDGTTVDFGAAPVAGKPVPATPSDGSCMGRGYLEKDWGTSMPTSWVWIQGNGFPDASVSVMISIARIPWLGRSFTGFLGFVATREHVFQFGTYSRARIDELDADGTAVTVVVKAGTTTVRIEGERTHTGLLAAPVGGAMDRRIAESLDASLRLIVIDRDAVVVDATGGAAGIELVGDIDSLR